MAKELYILNLNLGLLEKVQSFQKIVKMEIEYLSVRPISPFFDSTTNQTERKIEKE